MSTLAIGNFVRLSPPSQLDEQLGQYKAIQYAFQNFYIKQTVNFNSIDHGFLPFGFSGVTINRTGDGTNASLVFPNNELSRGWADAAIQNRWFAVVDVVVLDADNPGTIQGEVHSYSGQISGGKWDQMALTINLSTILDAVGADVPRRNLTQNLVGHLPVTSNVRLQ